MMVLKPISWFVNVKYFKCNKCIKTNFKQLKHP